MFTPEVIFLTILVFFLLVGIHEWGHFYFAKRAGILVREFAIGFGPKLFSFKKGETTYTCRIFPLGGFVRMAGEDPEVVQINSGQQIAVKVEGEKVTRMYTDQLGQRANVIEGVVESLDVDKKLMLNLDVDGERIMYPVHPEAMIVAGNKETQIAPWDRQFGSKTVGQRAMSIFAGPLMNFVLSFVLFVTFIYANGIALENPTYVFAGKISENSAAQKAGLQKNDMIKEVNGVQIGADSQKLIELISGSANKPMKWVVLRDGQEKVLTVTPQEQSVEGSSKKVGRVGLVISLPTRSPTVPEAFSGGWNAMIDSGKQIFLGLKQLVTLQFDLDDLGGPVRMVEVTGQAASMGVPTLLFWAAILSLYLGIFNLLPFPALDGSRLVFLGLEAVRGKPVDPSRESMVHFIGFAMLMLLMLAVTYNDILRLFRG